MKKKLLPLVLLLSLCAVMALSACSGGFSAIKVENPQTNFNYVVRSNGGSAVQYGPYIYFINGTRGYEETNEEGIENRWGEVVKGGVYRTELNEKATVADKPYSEHTGILYDFVADVTGNTKNYDDEPIDVVPNTRIAPLTAGTSGYAAGGLFIYDQYLFFASPSSQKDREGNIKTGLTDFMMMSLDGKTVKRVFSTKGEAANQPYGFYKMGDSVYLVCAYESEENAGKLDVVSVRIQNKKIHTPVYLTQKATALVLAVSATYDNSVVNPAPTLSDYVFFTRDVEQGEWPRTGNCIEVCRPDGSESLSFQKTGETTAIEGVRDGLLFYTVTTDGKTKVSYTNLHDNLMSVEPNAKVKKPAGSISYRAYEEAAAVKRRVFSGDVFTMDDLSQYTTRYFFRGAENNDGAYMLGISSSGVWVISARDNRYARGVRILTSSAEMLLVDGEYMYYLDGDAIYRTHIFTEAAGDETDYETVTDRSVISAGITADIVADHIMFFSGYDQWTKNFGYSYFKKLSQIGSSSFFVGTISENDKPTEDELKEYRESKGLATE